jgi:predicted alpha/beta-fold hydrolase
MFGALLRALPRPFTERERWELSDGDFIDVDLLPGRAGAPVLLLLHGLEGSARSHYVRGMMAQAQRLGWRAFGLNFRSCSEEPNRLLRSYHSGETGDLGEAVRRILPRLSGGPLLLAGFSLGGNVLVKWLGEQGESAPREIAGAAAVSVPFDLQRCAAALDARGLGAFLYRTRFLRDLKRKALAKASSFEGHLDERAIREARTLHEFDDVVTARVNGFADAHDYWARSSSGPFVAAVRRPLLLVSAVDDPIIPGGCLPLDAVRENPCVTLDAPEQGGHVGFVAGPPWAPRFWAEERAIAFFQDAMARQRPSARGN